MRDGTAGGTFLDLPETQMREIVRQAEAGYPEEICGVVVGRPGAPETYQVRQIRNIANADPQRDPKGVPRDARTAYRMDDLELLRVLREAESLRHEVVAFYHSHPDHDACFSAMDRDRALLSGEPLWPGASYLIVSVRSGRARDARAYFWNGAARGFVECPAVLPPS